MRKSRALNSRQCCNYARTFLLEDDDYMFKFPSKNCDGICRVKVHFFSYFYFMVIKANSCVI